MSVRRSTPLLLAGGLRAARGAPVAGEGVRRRRPAAPQRALARRRRAPHLPPAAEALQDCGHPTAWYDNKSNSAFTRYFVHCRGAVASNL